MERRGEGQNRTESKVEEIRGEERRLEEREERRGEERSDS
jgi:hypothetical protein